MPIRFITFDCAGTLIRVNWQPAAFAADCVERLGLPLDRPVAESIYSRLLQTRWRTYVELNRTRDPEICDGFWKELTFDWMAQVGLEEKWFDPIVAEAWEGLYGEKSVVFSLYEDSLPALQALKERGYRVAALSNWDYSLHRVVEMLGLKPYLEQVIASLEEGIEKPEPEIFRIALSRLGAKPEETLHVGDNVIDDVQGALGAGLSAVLLERNDDLHPPAPLLPPAGRGGVPRISSLSQLTEVLDWIG
jgi:REG-2-like HAD superfamily hydrolase